METNNSNNHLKFLDRAIALAWQARNSGNHPFGAILVRQGEIVVENVNTVISESNVLHHAELMLLNAAMEQLTPQELSECTLYTSTEPCVMCCGGIYWSGIRHLVYAFAAEELGNLAGHQFVVPCRELMAHTREKVEITGPFAIEDARKVHEGYWRNSATGETAHE